MKTIFKFFYDNRKHWEFYLIPIIVCLAFSALFLNDNTYVYTTEIQVSSKKNAQKLKPFDAASISVYQTMLKNPLIISAAQTALKEDYNIEISKNDLVTAITTEPSISGDSVKVKSSFNNSQVAVAMGKQVSKSLYYSLKTFLPDKQVVIRDNATLKSSASVSLGYTILISIILGLAIGISLQYWWENREMKEKVVVRDAK